MAENSLETTIATGLSIAALGASIAALIIANRTPDVPQILIYDPTAIQQQAVAYTAAGQDAFTVIDAAVEEATKRGYIVIDARIEIKGPASSTMRLDEFVAVGGAIGRPENDAKTVALPGTIPIDLSSAKANSPASLEQPKAGTPPYDDVESFARQLMNSQGGITVAPSFK